MWIFCCGMMRSGSTVQFQITARLVEDACLGKRLEWVKPEEFTGLRDKYSAFPGWKVFKSHICTQHMIREFENHNALGIYVYRDLRDVVVSILKKLKMSFDEEFVGNYLNTCLRQYSIWTGLPGVMCSKYENMLCDLKGEVRKIADHLGIRLSDVQYSSIASDYDIERQKERITVYKDRLAEEKIPCDGPVFDPHSLLHSDHINSGEIGQWEQCLTARQIMFIEQRTGYWLVSKGYKLMYPDLEHHQELLLNEKR